MSVVLKAASTLLQAGVKCERKCTHSHCFYTYMHRLTFLFSDLLTSVLLTQRQPQHLQLQNARWFHLNFDIDLLSGVTCLTLLIFLTLIHHVSSTYPATLPFPDTFCIYYLLTSDACFPRAIHILTVRTEHSIGCSR